MAKVDLNERIERINKELSYLKLLCESHEARLNRCEHFVREASGYRSQVYDTIAEMHTKMHEIFQDNKPPKIKKEKLSRVKKFLVAFQKYNVDWLKKSSIE